MRFLLVFIVLWLGSRPVFAQTQAPRPPDSLATAGVAAPAPDTLAAIHRLFAAKRKALRYVIGGTALAAGVGALIALAAPTDPPVHSGGGFGILTGGYSADDNALAAIVICVVSVPVMLTEVLFCGGWGRRSERRTVVYFYAHQLPPYMKRKLKLKYFR